MDFAPLGAPPVGIAFGAALAFGRWNGPYPAMSGRSRTKLALLGERVTERKGHSSECPSFATAAEWRPDA